MFSTEKYSIQQLIRFAVGLLIGGLSLYFVFRQTDFVAFYKTLKETDFFYIFLALTGFSMGYACRIWRWHAMFQTHTQEQSVYYFGAAYMASIALNNTLPFRAGDVLRVTALARVAGLTRTQSLSSLLAEKLIDLFILLSMLSLTVYFVPEIRKLAEQNDFLYLKDYAVWFFCLLAACPSLLFLFRKKLPIFIRKKLSSFLDIDRKKILIILILSLPVWLFETSLFYAVGKAFSLDFSASFYLFVMTVATLATLIPSTPGYFGTFHFVVFGLLTASGQAETSASAYAFLVHILMWLSTTLTGTLLFFTVIKKYVRNR